MEAIYSDYSPRFLYVDKYRFSRRWVYPTSVAPYGLIRYILSGSAVFNLNGKDYHVGPDDVFYIPQGSTFSCAAKEEIVFISIRFVDSIQSLGDDMLYELWHIPTQHSFADFPDIRTRPERVSVRATSHHNIKMLEIRGYLNLILAFLARIVADNFDNDETLDEDRRRMEAMYDVESIRHRANKTMQRNNDPRITAIVDYIICHPAQRITPQQMCQMADISESTLRRLFKAKTGKTLHEFVLEIKMTNAARRLLITNESISQIADALGFESPSYFSKRFREVYGMSPQAYRNASHEM